MSDTQSRQPANAPAAKSRSPVERIIVWGLIILLGLACLNEYLSKTGHETALKKLEGMVAAVDKDPKLPEVTEADVKDAVGGKAPSRVEEAKEGKPLPHGARKMEVYSWFTLNPMNKRDIFVYLSTKGKDGKELATVLGIESTMEPASEPKPAAAGPAMAGPPPGGGGTPPGGMMGGPPGGRRGAPAGDKPAETADADKNDGKAADGDKPGSDNAAEEKKTDEKPEEKTE